MINTILIIVGFLVFVYSTAYYYNDCKGKPDSTMGSEMSFSAYWTFGAVILCYGFLSKFSLSFWGLIPGCILIYLISLPIRRMIQKLACTSLKEELTGFQKFIQKTEKQSEKDK